MSRAPSSMKVISVNLGLPREVQWKGKTVSTAIFKTPVSNRITLRSLNLDGDRQADLSVHGGQNKAVYAYPAEHYSVLAARVSGYGVAMGHVRRESHDRRPR